MGVDIVEDDDEDVPVVRGGHRLPDPPPRRSEAPSPGPGGGGGDEFFEMLANPRKARSPFAPPPSGGGGSGGGGLTGADDSSFAFDDFGADDGDMEDEYGDGPGGGGGDMPSRPSEPRPTREEIFREKTDLLHRLHRLKERGFEVPQFDMRSDLDEMRFEFSKIERAAECRNAVNMMRQILVAGTSAIQFMNHRYDPIGLKLDGWSESVMANIGDYDNVFERLYDKHRGKVAMAPEIELILMVGGSALMFHMTASFTRAGLPSMSEIAKQDPELMKSLLKVMMKNSMDPSSGATGGAPAGVPPASVAPVSAPSSSGAGGREPYVMRGPMGGIDLGGAMEGARARAQAPPLSSLDRIVEDTLSSTRPASAVIVETLDGKVDDDSVAGSVAGDIADVRTVQLDGTVKKRRAPRKAKKSAEIDLHKVEMDL